MTEQVPGIALCLDCNYSLRGLAIRRCPECGREFDPDQPLSFNSGRPLNWLDRKLLAPLGAPTLALIIAPCVWLLYQSLGTDIFDFAVFIILSVLLCVAVSIVLGIRWALRHFIPP